MSEDDPTVDSGSITIRSVLKATAIDWIANTPPGGFYVGCAVLLVLLLGVDARWHPASQTWLDKNGAAYMHFAEIMLGALLTFKGAGKLIVHFTEKAKAKAASVLTVTAAAPASVSATASVTPTEQTTPEPNP